jgi:hypothetical protein
MRIPAIGAARFLPFPLSAAFEGTLKRLKELPKKAGMSDHRDS